jgi:RNA 2',3'-cyclic 3'-phosphodiesterase
MTRAFVAIRPPPAVLDAVEARVGGAVLRGGRRTTRDQWHLTVQFLGDGADVDAVEAAFASRPLDVGAGEIRLGGADALGRPGQARILALRLREGDQWARELAAQVQARLAPLGYVRDLDENTFLPHLTLARFRAPTDLRAVCSAIGPEPTGPAWRVDEVVFYESVLHRQGARHVARASFGFA